MMAEMGILKMRQCCKAMVNNSLIQPCGLSARHRRSFHFRVAGPAPCIWRRLARTVDNRDRECFAIGHSELDNIGAVSFRAEDHDRPLGTNKREAAEAANVRACRLAGAISRMSATYQHGLLLGRVVGNNSAHNPQLDTEGKKVHFPTVSNFLQESYFMHFRAVGRETPNTVNTSVVRTRRYLTGREVEKLIEAARKHGRYGHRDATMILLAYRHGLRASELCDLQWHQVELNTGRLHVRRSKRGTPSVHPMQGDEIRALRRLQREQEAAPYVFTSERGGPMSAKSFGTLFERLGRRAGMPFTIFPHMLRHACGYALANAGHDTRALQAWLGHKNIQHTVRYTELAPDRFKNFWR
jgi:integrase